MRTHQDLPVRVFFLCCTKHRAEAVWPGKATCDGSIALRLINDHHEASLRQTTFAA
jgi:hypothetical protein